MFLKIWHWDHANVSSIWFEKMVITNLGTSNICSKIRIGTKKTYRGKSAFGQGKVGISTPWIGLEFEQDKSPTVLPWNEPLKDKIWFIKIKLITGYCFSDQHILSTINQDLLKLFWNSNLAKLMFWISESVKVFVNLTKLLVVFWVNLLTKYVDLKKNNL